MIEKKEMKENIQLFELLKNESLATITTRKSIRKYTGEKITEVQLKTILNAGFCAPSAQNKQPWHFIILKDHEQLTEIGTHNMYTGMFQSADVCIVVCGDRHMQGINELLLADTCAATQNLLLAAHAIGIGAVWCGVVQSSEWEKYLMSELQLPDNIRPISVVAMGHPAEVREAHERFDVNKIHEGKW